MILVISEEQFKDLDRLSQEIMANREESRPAFDLACVIDDIFLDNKKRKLKEHRKPTQIRSHSILHHLTEDDIYAIYVRTNVFKEKNRALAKEYGVSEYTISNIKTKSRWRDIIEMVEKAESG